MPLFYSVSILPIYLLALSALLPSIPAPLNTCFKGELRGDPPLCLPPRGKGDRLRWMRGTSFLIASPLITAYGGASPQGEAFPPSSPPSASRSAAFRLNAIAHQQFRHVHGGICRISSLPLPPEHYYENKRLGRALLAPQKKDRSERLCILHLLYIQMQYNRYPPPE